MAGGPHLDCVEARVTEHRAEVFGVIPPRPEAKDAEEMTERPVGRRAEIDGHHAPPWLEHAPDFCQPSTLQLVGQMVKHEAVQHHVEVVVRIRERLDRSNLEAYPHARLCRVSVRELELWVKHLGPVWNKNPDWMKQALVNWYAEMQTEGLAPAGANKMQTFVREGLTLKQAKQPARKSET